MTRKTMTGPRTAADLLDVMSENIQMLRDEERTPAVANAIVASAATMVRMVTVQMAYAKMRGTTPDIPLLGAGK